MIVPYDVLIARRQREMDHARRALKAARASLLQSQRDAKAAEAKRARVARRAQRCRRQMTDGRRQAVAHWQAANHYLTFLRERVETLGDECAARQQAVEQSQSDCADRVSRLARATARRDNLAARQAEALHVARRRQEQREDDDAADDWTCLRDTGTKVEGDDVATVA